MKKLISFLGAGIFFLSVSSCASYENKSAENLTQIGEEVEVITPKKQPIIKLDQTPLSSLEGTIISKENPVFGDVQGYSKFLVKSGKDEYLLIVNGTSACIKNLYDSANAGDKIDFKFKSIIGNKKIYSVCEDVGVLKK